MRHYCAHLVYSNQRAQGVGAVTGGLTNFIPPPGATSTSITINATLSPLAPKAIFLGAASPSVAINYGSGFLSGNGPSHLPSYYTLDLSVGKNFGENFTVRFAGTNITNQRYMLDTSNTFGGTHYADPGMLAVQVRWRFHY
jgi:outer membrane receptor protein involved in Fe transport